MILYYNDNDTASFHWLVALTQSGVIPQGTVDPRDIQDIIPSEGDLDGYAQCHFFAGIGGWAYALQLAGWPVDRPVWTGSCPCQPFSIAGKGKGVADDRHVWPIWRELIAECRPPTIFGEQVASPLGRDWLAGVRFDLENIKYWSTLNEDMHEVLEAKTTDGLSEILGKVIGRVEATVCRVPEEVRSGVSSTQPTEITAEAQRAQGQGEEIPPTVQYGKSRETPDSGSSPPMQEEGDSIRSGRPRGGGRGTDTGGGMRDVRNKLRLPLTRGGIKQSIPGQDQAGQRVCLFQHSCCLLCDECGNGKLGGEGATADSKSVVKKDILNDKSKISTVFGVLIKRSVERISVSGVRADLEVLGYEVGAADLCAAGVGAPHIRQRLFWVANSKSRRQPSETVGVYATENERQKAGGLGDASYVGGVANSKPQRRRGRGDGDTPRHDGALQTEGPRASGGVGNASSVGLRRGCANSPRQQPEMFGEGHAPASYWSDFGLVHCRDEKARRIEPGTQQMVNGLSRAVELLCAQSKETIRRLDNATESVDFGGEVLRQVRHGDEPGAVWREVGRRVGIPQATVLLTLLCEHSRELGQFFYGEAERGPQAHRKSLRGLRRDSSPVALSPQGRELSQQRYEQLKNALSKLSQENTHFTEVLSGLASFNGFPLAPRLPGHVAKLRGLGNAIVPQITATFIRAFMEIKNETAVH